MEFSERLRLLRTQAQMTQEELAAKLFVTRQAVSNYEQGIRYPSLDTLVRIAQLFGVSLDELLSTSLKRRYVGCRIALVTLLVVCCFVAAACGYAAAQRAEQASPMLVIGPLLLPCLFSLIAVFFGAYPPRKINRFAGYRTRRAMRNQTMWDYAQAAFALHVTFLVIAQLAGTIVWLIVSVFLPVSACLIGGMCLLLVQTISLFVPILATERKLRRLSP